MRYFFVVTLWCAHHVPFGYGFFSRLYMRGVRRCMGNDVRRQLDAIDRFLWLGRDE